MSSTTLASDAKLQSCNNNNKKKKKNNFQASYQLFKSIEKIVDELDKKAANEPFKFNPRHEVTRSDFTKICPDFTFGAAGAAYQLEGATKEGGRGPSIWDHVCETPGKIADGSNGNTAADSYHLYKEDIKLLKSLGVDHYRFSISWSRILPSGKLSGGVNRAGVECYNNLIDELLANGIKPFATIFHFDTPQALEDEYGGFLGDQIVDDFRDYARVCFWEFGDRVKLWATVNEPYTYCFMGYAIGGMAPFHGAPKTQANVDISKYSNRELGKMIREVIDGLREPSGQVNLLKGVVDGSEGDISDAINDLAQETSAETSHETVVHNWVKLLFGKDRTCKYYPSTRGCPSHNNSQSDDIDIGYNNDPGREPYIAAHYMLLCHAAAVQVYKENFQACQKGRIGLTLATNWYEPLRVKTDKQIRDQALDFYIGWFLQPVTTGDYPETMKKIVQDRLPKFTKEQSRLLKGSCDFIGLQYYTTGYVTYGDPEPNGIPNCQYDSGSKYSVFDEDGKPIGPRCGSDWLHFYPKGIQSLLKYVKEKYNNPVIYITENGVSELNDVSKSVSEALNDQNRIVYHKEHLYYVHKAMINDNVNVQGYFVWSLLDNFEWAAGYTVRFGMVYVDYKDACARYPKMSAYWFKNFLKGNVDDDDSTHVTPSCGAPIISTLPRRISIAPTLMAEQNDQMQITSPEDSPVANTKRSLPMLEAAESKRTKV